METIVLYAPAPAPTPSRVSVSYEDLLNHPERYYQGSDIVWMLISSALVFIMIPALSLIYAGLGNRSFALTLFRLPLITGAFIGFQWVLWGYSLTFTRSILPASWWGGESRALALTDVLARPIAEGDGNGGPSIPELVYVLYEGMFAAFTAALVCGGTMHKVRPARFLVFISIWSILVYDPVARWSWDADGWSNKLGSMDFAGGTPVHIVSGTTVAAFAVFCAIEKQNSLEKLVEEVKIFFEKLSKRIRRPWRIIWRTSLGLVRFCAACCFGKRIDGGSQSDHDDGDAEPRVPFEPYNVNYLVLGTALLWFGWAGFNGGSALGGNLRAVSAWTSTHIAACTGGTVGVFLTWYPKTLAWLYGDVGREQPFDSLTVLYFCDGAIAGLVAITPAAGYVPVWSAAIFGATSAIFVHLLKKEASIFLKEDPLQVFAVHTGGGIVGMLLTGLLASSTTIGLDGHSTIPHPEYTKGQRFGYQLVDASAGVGYTFFVTLAILYFMKLVVYIFRPYFTHNHTGWWATTGFSEHYLLEDRLQATEQQRWAVPNPENGHGPYPIIQTPEVAPQPLSQAELLTAPTAHTE